ncbi:MAG: hypothetical protein FJ027_08250 [Candidatus Rokubacteria bacterium]|nr:hypothetical protein [Candidatus Rokubacteria bacterium]
MRSTVVKNVALFLAIRAASTRSRASPRSWRRADGTVVLAFTDLSPPLERGLADKAP